uniref:Uncharacterized protein n=1 Tax=Alexandrium monilatum TaxID=311494 RepID=A0A7S4T4H8_9DINO
MAGNDLIDTSISSCEGQMPTGGHEVPRGAARRVRVFVPIELLPQTIDVIDSHDLHEKADLHVVPAHSPPGPAAAAGAGRAGPQQFYIGDFEPDTGDISESPAPGDGAGRQGLSPAPGDGAGRQGFPLVGAPAEPAQCGVGPLVGALAEPAQCGVAADRGAIDEGDGQWFCEQCWRQEAELGEQEAPAEPVPAEQAEQATGTGPPRFFPRTGIGDVGSGSLAAVPLFPVLTVLGGAELWDEEGGVIKQKGTVYSDPDRESWGERVFTDAEEALLQANARAAASWLLLQSRAAG